MISLDTETTGRDLRHGARPFYVTTCDENGDIQFWDWWVDPLTRMPVVPPEDLDAIEELIGDETGHELILQNTKFDFAALQSVWTASDWDFGWDRVHDTLIAGHLLFSNRPHNLTAMALQYLQVDIEPYEKTLRTACVEARRLAKSVFPDWKIAKAGVEGMPSAKETVWKYDTWLPKVLATELGYDEGHPWYTVLQEYSNVDAEITIALWQVQREMIKNRGLWAIYQERLKVLPIAYKMESRGITISKTNLRQLRSEYGEESARLGRVCTNIAASLGYELDLPKGSNNKSLMQFCFGSPINPDDENSPLIQHLNLPVVVKTEKGNPSLDKEAVEIYLTTLNKSLKPYHFINALRSKRKRDTALSYMESYERFWRPWYPVPGEDPVWYVLHPSLNPTGTDTLRWSSSNPNEQNISKQEGFNLRFCFGPAPGREWWSLDAQNIELRLPAYESGQQELIELFERPNDPPYFGSNHLLVAHILHPKMFEECLNDNGELDGRIFKKKYVSTWYQWVKNGNFAVQYGAVEASGTADRAYHIPGAQRIIQARFNKLAALNQKCIRFAEIHGYVETIPDKTVDPKRGYPIMCSRTDYGKIKPTVPLNYHIQSTAMWWTMKGMIRCQAQLDDWNKKLRPTEGDGYHIALQVHDEMVFDFPKRANPKTNPKASNLGRIRILQKLMADGGDDIGIPTPVGVEYNEHTWSEGITL